MTQSRPTGELVFTGARSEHEAAPYDARGGRVYRDIDVRSRVVINLDTARERRSRRESVNNVVIGEGIARRCRCRGDEWDADAA